MARPSFDVLVVHGSAPVVATISAILPPHGCKVASIATAREAVRVLEKVRFDVLITGIEMADMDGVELMRHLNRRADPVPVIALAEAGRDRCGAKAREMQALGADTVLALPVEENACVDAVFRALHRPPRTSYPHRAEH